MLSAFEIRHQIIAKYLLKNILLIFLAIFLFLVLILLGNQTVLLLAKYYDFGISIENTVLLILFNLLKKTPLLLSFSLFLAIIISIGRLYKNSEMIVINSIGISTKHLMVFIQPILLSVAFIIFIITIYLSPLLIVHIDKLYFSAQEINKIAFIKAKTFTYFKRGKIIFYAQEVTKDKNLMKQIFLKYQRIDKTIIITADTASIDINDKNGNTYLTLTDGKIYSGLPDIYSDKDSITHFKKYLMPLHSKSDVKNSDDKYFTNIQAIPTKKLLDYTELAHRLELERRLFFPIATIILAMLATVLAKTSPKGSQLFGVLIGIVLFILYYNLLAIAHGFSDISQSFGFWWVHALFIVLLYIFYRVRRRKIY